MSLQWKELDKKVSMASIPNGIDFYVEEVNRPSIGERFYKASVIDHNC